MRTGDGSDSPRRKDNQRQDGQKEVFDYLPAVKITNVEIKARCAAPDIVRRILTDLGARFAGRDHQVDTYYRVPDGRLKLRQGNIENALIAYARPDSDGPKQSDVLLYKTHDGEALKQILDAVHKRLVVVDKNREIYFIENVKFHIDDVGGLGSFVEIEAIDNQGTIPPAVLKEQCEHYIDILGIEPQDLLTHSYSDMMIAGS